MRDNYKFQILQDPKYQGAERLHLLEQIKVNPKVVDFYSKIKI